jgi:hypothetical protein
MAEGELPNGDTRGGIQVDFGAILDRPARRVQQLIDDLPSFVFRVCQGELKGIPTNGKCKAPEFDRASRRALRSFAYPGSAKRDRQIASQGTGRLLSTNCWRTHLAFDYEPFLSEVRQ